MYKNEIEDNNHENKSRFSGPVFYKIDYMSYKGLRANAGVNKYYSGVIYGYL